MEFGEVVTASPERRAHENVGLQVRCNRSSWRDFHLFRTFGPRAAMPSSLKPRVLLLLERRSFRRGPIRSVRNQRIRWNGRLPMTPRGISAFSAGFGPGKFHSLWSKGGGDVPKIREHPGVEGDLDPWTCERFFCAKQLRRKEGRQGGLADQGFRARRRRSDGERSSPV